MRKALLIFTVAALASCKSGDNTKVKSMSANDATAANASSNYAYTAQYSSKFEIADPGYTKTILDIYKDWENNDVDNMKLKFADSVFVRSYDGTVFTGPRDTVFEQIKNYRKAMPAMRVKMGSFVALKSIDMNSNWFVTWFFEKQTDAKGKLDSVNLIENWRINNDGKVDYMNQYVQFIKPAK